MVAYSLSVQGSSSAPSGVVSFVMPVEGHATIAINSTNGVRVRNLLADLPYSKGLHTVEWDGRDDNGTPVAPGSYQWTGLYRGDLHAVYRGSFQYGNPPWLCGTTGGWTADHCYPVTVAAVGDRMLIGSTEAEWGHGLIACDLEGHKQWGVRWLDKRAWSGADALAVVGDRVFATSGQDEAAVWEVDPASGENKLVWEKKDWLAGNPESRSSAQSSVKSVWRVIGAQAVDGALNEVYVSDVFSQPYRTYVLSAGKRGERLRLLRTLPVRPFALAWLADGRCLAVVERSIDILDTQTGTCRPFIKDGLSAPWSVATDHRGHIFVADQGATGLHKFTPYGQLPWHYLRLDGEASHQIKIFDSAGKLLRAMGVPGGQGEGRLDPKSFYRPAGLAVDTRDRLWVTEMNFSPKRVSVWEIPPDLEAEAPALVRQFVGPTAYGGGAFMPDARQPWRIVDQTYGVLFDVNLDAGKYDAIGLPWRCYDSWKQHAYRPDLPFMGKPGVIFDLEGRRFAACFGGYGHAEGGWEPYRFNATGPVMIGEYRGDRFVPLAAIGNIRMWLRGRELDCRREEQWLPPVVIEAARRLPGWPDYAARMKMDPQASDVPHVTHKRGSGDWIVHPWPKEISGLIWVDANGDGRMQVDEVSLHALDDADTLVLDRDLNAYLPVPERCGGGVYKFSRNGFNKVGAPVYSWSRFEKLRPDYIDLRHVGGDGSWLSPNALYRADGSMVWSYPSSPKSTRELGANKRDVLTPGHIYRVNSLRGVVAGPADLGDVFMLNSVDGMTYFLTREDGLFITTLFRPAAFAAGWDSIPEAKPGLLLDDYSLQEECFAGSFVRAEADGKGFEKGHYYMLGLGRSAVVELTGLDSVKRFEGGMVPLAAGQGLYGRGERFDPAVAMSRLPVKSFDKSESLVAPHTRPGADTFSAKPAEFMTARVWAGWDRRGLHLKWYVTGDTSPFVNNEQDWTRLFASGDACDVQVGSPAFGKCRYVIAMSRQEPVVVRIRYEGKDAETAMTYRSGVAETHVAAVEKLAVKCQIKRGKDNYSVQVTLPWNELGIEPRAGLKVPFELGLMISDPTGTKTMAREYWHSGMTGTVADLPSEAAPTKDWGVLELK